MYEELITSLKENNLYDQLITAAGAPVVCSFFGGSRTLGDSSLIDKESDYDCIQFSVGYRDDPRRSKLLYSDDGIFISFVTWNVLTLDRKFENPHYWGLYMNSFGIKNSFYTNPLYQNQFKQFSSLLEKYRKYFIIGTSIQDSSIIGDVLDDKLKDIDKAIRFKSIYHWLILYAKENNEDYRIDLIKKIKRFKKDEITDDEIVYIKKCAQWLKDYATNNSISFITEYNSLLNDLKGIKW